MFAAIGDRLVVHSQHLDGPTRDAEIVEVRHEDGSPPYVVRWSDTGHETLVFPGPDATVEHFEHGGAVSAGAPDTPLDPASPPA